MLTVAVILGVLTVASAVAVVASVKPLNSALWLVVTLCLVAAHFALLGAHFLAAIQVFVYAGAIMVLVIFVLMLLGSAGEAAEGRGARGYLAAAIGGVLIAFLVWISSGAKVAPVARGAPGGGTTAEIGRALLTTHVYAFEVVSVLILAAILGAVILAFEPKRPLPPGRGLEAMRGRE